MKERYLDFYDSYGQHICLSLSVLFLCLELGIGHNPLYHIFPVLTGLIRLPTDYFNKYWFGIFVDVLIISLSLVLIKL